MSTEYLVNNRIFWNNNVEAHLKSDFYDVKGFLEGKTSLKEIELDLLGDIKGKKILHLQCHFGQDTLSLSRMGAECTGVDFSEKAIDAARQLNEQCGENARFICCDIFDLPQHLNESFDLVFTSYGVVGWLPELKTWAEIISRFLKPGGKFIMAEFHPFVWMFDNDFNGIQYSYFNVEPIVETETGSYADRESGTELTNITWNHPLSEVFQNLVRAGLQINSINEYDFSPYNCFRNTIESEPGKFRIQSFDSKLPLVYSLTAEKQE